MTTAILFTNEHQSLTSDEALQRCYQALQAQPSVAFIFFYFDAVNVVKDIKHFPQWEALKTVHGIDLITCSTAAKNRQCGAFHSGPFVLAGLSEFYSKLHNCNTLVQI
jgi:sulfur relay (sulfurtransferase) complex TusBCD TusD component (DsrE family)